MDSTHRLLFITPDNGETINEVSVRFHPSEISFYENDVNIVLALDKMSPLPSVSFIILHCILCIHIYIYYIDVIFLAMVFDEYRLQMDIITSLCESIFLVPCTCIDNRTNALRWEKYCLSD